MRCENTNIKQDKNREKSNKANAAKSTDLIHIIIIIKYATINTTSMYFFKPIQVYK